MQGTGVLGALESTPLALAMRHELWLYPAVEILHIAGFVVLVGSIGVLDLRLLGFSRTLPVTALTRHVVPWTLGAFALIVPTGLLMFSAHASELVANRAFQIKLLLIFAAAVNAGLFRSGVKRTIALWDHDSVPPARVRLHAGASLLLWFGVITCGRLLAYV